MELSSQKRSTTQNILGLELALIIAFISTVIIFTIDTYLFKHIEFSPLTEFQFYGVVFIVTLGLVLSMLFYREEKVKAVDVETDYKGKMSKKKLKKARKATR